MPENRRAYNIQQFSTSTGAIVSGGGETGYYTEDNLPDDSYATLTDPSVNTLDPAIMRYRLCVYASGTFNHFFLNLLYVLANCPPIRRIRSMLIQSGM